MLPEKKHPSALKELLGELNVSVHNVLRARARRSPDVMFARHCDRTWSFSKALDCSSRFAGFIRHVLPKTAQPRVSSFLSNRPEALWGWFGANIAGGIFVAINGEHRGPVLADQLARSGAHILVTEQDMAQHIPSLTESDITHVVFVDEPTISDKAILDQWKDVVVYRLTDVLKFQPIAFDSGSATDPASLLFTSGTTGRSKACLVPHAQLCRGADTVVKAMNLRQSDVFHNWLPLAHIASQQHMVMTALISGASLTFFPRFSLSKFWSEVRSVNATIFSGQGTIGQLLLAQPIQHGDQQNSLRAGVLSAIPDEQRLEFERRFSVEVYDFYGMTEAEPITVAGPGHSRPRGSVGRASGDFELAIVNEEFETVDSGTPGHIVVRPRVPGVMMVGYEGDKDTNAASFNNAWFRTKDLGYLDEDGYLYFVEREKHAIRRGGENISSLEVEKVILSHPDITLCAVVGVESELLGQEVKAVIVSAPGKSISERGVHEWCKNKMATFMIPRYIEIRQNLPYTGFGKLEHDKLRGQVNAVWDAKEK